MSGVVNTVGETPSGIIGARDAMAGGAVQIVQATNNTETTMGTTNNTWEDTVVIGAITPKFNDSQILIFQNFIMTFNNSSSDGGIGSRTKRVITGGATSYPQNISIQEGTSNAHSMHYVGYAAGAGSIISELYQTMYIDEPATTSVVTYTLQGAPYNIDAFVVGGTYTSRWYCQLMEIAN